MELKDMVLSTLAEIEKIQFEEKEIEKIEQIKQQVEVQQKPKILEIKPLINKKETVLIEEEIINKNEDIDKEFFISLQERLLVLFEGLQATPKDKISSRLDMTLNFLEYLLATIDDKLEPKDNEV